MNIELKTLGDVCENVSKPFDFSNHQKVVFVNTGDVLDGKFLHKNYSKKEGLPGQAKKAIQREDILFSEIRPINKRFAFVDEECDEYVVSTKFMVLRPNDNVIPKYLFHYLKCDTTLKNLQREAESRSGTFPQITFDAISYFSIPIPTKKEQERISAFIDNIEKQIELNKKINQNLEETAKTLFKSWFIDFDPVRAKAEGRPTGLSKEISDLFPDSFEDSELGEIPKGWKIRSLGNFYAVNKGLSYKGKFLTEHGMPMINLGCFGGNGLFLKEKIKPYSGEFKERHIISKGEIAIANTDMTQNRITLGSPIIVDEINGNSDFLFTHHVFSLNNISDRGDLKHFTYYTLLNPRFRGIAGNYATGTTVLALPKDAIENLQIVLPSKQILSAFNEIAGLNFKKSRINYKESIVLGDLRDKLLPKLISGELKIQDAENLIKEEGI